MIEFDLIRKYFATQAIHRQEVAESIGDDAAIVSIPAGNELAITTHTHVHHVHFPKHTNPADIGHKSLAVNLSDLAAMGATPAWITLALTLPDADETWIKAFCEGFFTLANRFHVQLIGGDLTRGPLSITIQAHGLVPKGQAILRSGAKSGDLIYITGTLGDAGLALAILQEKISADTQRCAELNCRLNRPEPRVAIGEILRGRANAAIDISDGFAADLMHLLDASKVGAKINIDKLPHSEALSKTLTREHAVALALTAGDDYELCFTVPPAKQVELEKALSHLTCRVTCVGIITAQPGLTFHDEQGHIYEAAIHGYQHF